MTHDTDLQTAPVRVPVGLGDRAYDIHIGRRLLVRSGAFISPHLRRPRVWVVSDAKVAGHFAGRLGAGLEAAGIAWSLHSLPPGEATKSWARLEETVEWLIAQKVERDDVVLALGGGVIGDLVGFAAAILRRGVRFVQVPTSLLAQVDSSVGGKTGINSPLGKNLIGAFHQPVLVLADIDTLDHLTPRDFLAGYAEVSKYGLLGDADFWEWLEAYGPAVASGDSAARIRAVERSCQMKAEIVARDEFERGDRALLNLGHTFGHALEAATGYGNRLLHGEGVSIGCALAFEVSARMGLCPQEAPSRVRAHFAAMGMRKDIADIPGDLPSADALIDLMRQDKKVQAGALTFIMARDVGEAFVTRDVDLAVVRAVLDEALAS
ncbi:MAG: 3-dehydroquinate synthase [Pseudomonadota bacterium]